MCQMVYEAFVPLYETGVLLQEVLVLREHLSEKMLIRYNSVQIRELKLSPSHLQAVLLQITTLVIIGCGTQIDPRF